MGLKSGHYFDKEFFFPPCYQQPYWSFETWSKWNLLTLALLNIAAFSFLFLLYILGPKAVPISRISNLVRVPAPPLLVCFLAAINKKRIKYLKVWRFPGHSLVSSCFQFSQKFCDLVAKKWEAMDCVNAIIELRQTTLFMKSIEIKDFLWIVVILISLPFYMFWSWEFISCTAGWKGGSWCFVFWVNLFV